MSVGKVGGAWRWRVGARVALVCGAACMAGCGDRGKQLSDLELVDFTPNAMFIELAAALERAHVLEVAPSYAQERSDLRLDRPWEADVLDALHELDPKYRYELRGDVLLALPDETLVPDNPFDLRLESFRAEGGAATVIRQLIQTAGLEGQVALIAQEAGARRPVAIDARSVLVRDVLIEVAAQAHLGFKNTPTAVRLYPVR